LGAGLNGTLWVGGHALLRERFVATDVAQALGSGEVTMFFGVPTMYVRLLEQTPPDLRFDAVRLFVSGSAALPASVHQQFTARFDKSILERYGSTEFGFALSNPYEGPRVPGHVGFPLPGVAVRLLGPSEGDAAPGEEGEVAVKGDNVFQGYWRNDASTQKAFWTAPDGSRWFRSGDVAVFDPVKGYRISGRIKELIISGGFNIYPAEVEFELLDVPGVKAAAVVGQPHPARGEVPVAFVEAEPGFDPEQALAALTGRIASFKVPKAIHVIDALPRNAMGKVEKPRLKALLTEGS
jgi:malonyl-CoA/methylmalonyl-CoA synthetase